MRIFFKLMCICLVAVLIAPPPLWASNDPVKKIGTFAKWQVFKLEQGKASTCYMLLRPEKVQAKKETASKTQKKELKKETKKPEKNKKENTAKSSEQARSDVYIMVTLRPSEGLNPVVSYRAGTIFKTSSEVIARMGKKEFNLFTQNDQAWARTTAIDLSFTQSLRGSKNLSLLATDQKNRKITDQFDLTGADQAYQATAKACGLDAPSL